MIVAVRVMREGLWRRYEDGICHAVCGTKIDIYA